MKSKMFKLAALKALFTGSCFLSAQILTYEKSAYALDVVEYGKMITGLCAYRYLCGGACRAWDNRESTDLNAPPVRCDHLQQTARNLIDAACNYL